MNIGRANTGPGGQGLWSGVTPEEFLSLVEGIHVDPDTGDFDPGDIFRLVKKNMTPEFARKMQGDVEKIEEVDLSSYDFGALASTITPNSVWIIDMEFECMVDPSQISDDLYREKPIDEDTARRTPGALPRFNLFCKFTLDPGRGGVTQIPRWITHSSGLPSSQKVLDFLKHAIATPFIGMPPALPSHLYVCQKFAAHMSVLRPFLDSLHPPFQWNLETPSQASELEDIADLGRRDRLAKAMADAQSAKTAGNAAFAAGDRTGALKHYTDAVDVFSHTPAERPSEEDVKQVMNLWAVCLSNKAAAHLVEGEGRDPKSALSDAEAAERTYPSYVKPYFRQSIAHELLGDVEKAKEAIRRGLDRPEFANDKALRERLAVLESAGAPKTEEA